ncbi:GNAT family N-acetyltransferase [Pseudoalteromonas sp. L23]|uniref:GNAT family N-acetyltransferase n=1 Tax=Pseudoalteromonas sp. L23 TaxID=2912259 RepID=UPI001EF06AAB|nr:MULTISPECIES: GNAT family N-acetyltransferase [unclassified Pseudoalteromonas]MCF7514214.1 GNAT family N-acetyltransferase [Pseudoalteromonas sp. L7]MCF7526032.1 GNAT family N-acetyltransferase [Pseudoalteromonas sp. L23]MCX2769314.1 GNAT family N-acetyltransferase [Pseudoalteromonas sp. B530]
MFLHDLVVSQAVSGQGIGALMIKRLVELATQMGYCRIRLVAVQNSVGFWLMFQSQLRYAKVMVKMRC